MSPSSAVLVCEVLFAFAGGVYTRTPCPGCTTQYLLLFVVL